MRAGLHKFSKGTKKKALKKAGYACSRCGVALTMISAEPHHIIPVSEGGLTTPENLQILCRACHVALHKKMEG